MKIQIEFGSGDKKITQVPILIPVVVLVILAAVIVGVVFTKFTPGTIQLPGINSPPTDGSRTSGVQAVTVSNAQQANQELASASRGTVGASASIDALLADLEG